MKFILMVLGLVFLATTANAESFISIREKIKDTKITELKRQEIIETYIGKRVVWNGWVDNVKAEGGTFYCRVDMDPPETIFSASDLRLVVNESVAKSLKRDQPVRVTGTIKAIDTTLGFRVKLNKGYTVEAR